MTVTDLRRFTIGGSDAAAACGIDPFKSRIMLWAEKTGRVERPETEAMRWGKLLEPLVFGELELRGYVVTPWQAREGEPPHDPERKWLTGTPDALVAEPHDTSPPVTLLEVKTVGQWAHRANGGDVPPQYAAQIQHYLHLTGLDIALLVVLVGGQRLELREVVRSVEAIRLMLELEADFYDHLRRDKPPAPDGSQSARDALLLLFPGAEPGKVIRLDREHWQLKRELVALSEHIKVCQTQKTEKGNRLKAFMGDAELAISPHDTDALRWSNVRATHIDTKALREHRPEVAAEYETTTTTRRFTLL